MITLLVEINYIRILIFIFENLKISPEAIPFSLNYEMKDYFYKEYEKVEQYNYHVELQKIDNIKITTNSSSDSEMKAKAKKFVQSQKITKSQENAEFAGIIDNKTVNRIYKVMIDDNNDSLSNEAVLNIFLLGIDQIFKKLINKDFNLFQCLKQGSDFTSDNCPKFFADYRKFIEESDYNTINLSMLTHTLIGMFNASHEDILSNVEEFINSLYIYAKYEIQKININTNTNTNTLIQTNEYLKSHLPSVALKEEQIKNEFKNLTESETNDQIA